MVPIARRNLLAEKGRLLISAGGVAFAVLLVLVVLGVYRGFGRTGETFELLPGQLWIAQQGTTDPFHSLSLIKSSDLEATRRVQGVSAAAPVLVRQMSFEAAGRVVSARLMALDVPAAFAASSEIRERYLPEPGVLIIDKILAAKQGLHEGQGVDVNGVHLIVGKVQPRSPEAFQPFAFLNYADAERIFGVQGVFNFGMLLVQPGQDAADVKPAIQQQVPGVEALTKEEFAGAVRKEIDETFLPIIAIILTIGFTVGGAVVGLTLYTATIERSRDFGVMKAVGASAGFLYRIVIWQSAILTLSGFIIGLVAALVVSKLATSAVPDFTTDYRYGDVVEVLLATALTALVASLLPVRRINGIDPAMVFKA